MIRSLLAAVAALSVGFAAAHAQPVLVVGAGLTSPLGDLADEAEAGYHVAAAVHLGIPTLPVGVRFTGSFHNMGASGPAFDGTQVVAGAVDVVFSLPGVGLVPYVLGGVGRSRIESGPSGAAVQETAPGYHAGFGLNLGQAGFGAFAEVRYVRVTGEVHDLTYLPLTVGLRF